MVCFTNFLTGYPMPLPQCSNNADKVLTKYIRARDGTKLVLNYRHQEANAIRSALQRIRLTGDKAPSLSLIARRSMGLYIAHLESSPSAFADEIQALEQLATPVSNRKPGKHIAPRPLT